MSILAEDFWAASGPETCEVEGPESLPILQELEQANLRFGVYRQALRTLLPWCRAIAHVRGGVEILDMGCGTGGLLRHLARNLSAEGIPFEGLGLDLNRVAIQEARAAVARERRRRRDGAGGTLAFATGGLEALRSRRADLVVGTFLMHHLDSTQLREFFEALKASARFAIYQLDFRPDGPRWMRSLWQGALALSGYARETRADGLVSIERSRPANTLADLGRDCGLRLEIRYCLGLCLEVRAIRLGQPEGRAVTGST